MNELQVFNYESNEVRTVMIDGEPWFVLKDVCQVLGISKYRDVASRLDDDERGLFKMDTLGGLQEMTIINESGLYSVILRSDKPEAKPFRKWVTSKVLPSIRKTGEYSTSKTIQDTTKASLAEARLLNSQARERNSRVKEASMWLEIAKVASVPSYFAICAHYASTALAGKEVLPLPETGGRTYTAKEVGEILGGISANKIGRLANKNDLKTPEYGVEVWDKSPHSGKQIPSWRYNEKGVERLRQIVEAPNETV